MKAIQELHLIIDSSSLENGVKVKKQLDLLATLPGDHNEHVFNKLLELAKHDPNAIMVFIEQFIKTSLKLLNK